MDGEPVGKVVSVITKDWHVDSMEAHGIWNRVQYFIRMEWSTFAIKMDTLAHFVASIYPVTMACKLSRQMDRAGNDMGLEDVYGVTWCATCSNPARIRARDGMTRLSVCRAQCCNGAWTAANWAETCRS